MKKLKNLVVMILFFNAFVHGQSTLDEVIINQNRVKIEFNNQFEFDDLIAVREECKKYKIELIYTKLEFNEDMKLNKISATIKLPDGKIASFESRELKSKDGPGFRISYNDEKQK